MGIWNWRFSLGILLVLTSVAGFSFWADRVTSEVGTVRIATAAKDIPQGETITPVAVRVVEAPKRIVPPSAIAFTESQAVIGQQAMVPLQAGQWLMTGDVGNLAPRPGELTMTIPVSLSTFGGAQPGDTVAIGAISSGQGGAAVTLFAGQPVRLLSLLDGSGHPLFGLGEIGVGGGGFPGNGSLPAVAVLALTPAQAGELLPYDVPNATLQLQVVGSG